MASEQDGRFAGSFLKNEPAETESTKEAPNSEPEPDQSRATELRDLALLALELFGIPIEQKLAQIEYEVALQRLMLRHRLGEAIDRLFPWLILIGFGLWSWRVSVRQQRQRSARADLEAHEPGGSGAKDQRSALASRQAR
jgi:hypothetical protein